MKRPRSTTNGDGTSSQSGPSSRSSSPMPTPKAVRITPECNAGAKGDVALARPLVCTLPPTCNPPANVPTQLASTAELEAHYAKYHAHVCEERGCGAVFPEQHLLELHQTECHDPLAAVRRDKGEKIFACHLATCTRSFQTPKTRRLHLIQAHGYPKEYFFAVTNKGVGGLLKKWGEGASLLRPAWKARAPANGERPAGDNGSTAMDEDEGESDDVELEDNARHDTQELPNGEPLSQGKTDIDPVDAVSGNLDSLSLVPNAVRFGRGGKPGRLVRPRHGNAQRKDTSVIASAQDSQPYESHGRGGRQRQRDRARAVGPSSDRARRSQEMDADSVHTRLGGTAEQNLDEPVSINIDAALEALKTEAAFVSASVSQAKPRQQVRDYVPLPVLGQGFAPSGRGRGRGRGAGRVRGILQRGRT